MVESNKITLNKQEIMVDSLIPIYLASKIPSIKSSEVFSLYTWKLEQSQSFIIPPKKKTCDI